MSNSPTLITHIGRLLQLRPPEVVRGKAMSELPELADAWLLIEGDRIADFGAMSELPETLSESSSIHHFSAKGGWLFPAWCDSHTHLVYAGSREKEYADRISGLSYEEIARKGGGILNSAARLQSSPEDLLLEGLLHRLDEISQMGTGAVEIKSGYGLNPEAEYKMLRVIKKAKEHSPLTIKATFLGAHALPADYSNRRKDYVDLIVNEMIPHVASEGLADFNDVFCDRGFFTPDETERILEAGNARGLRPKIHANELDFSGGIQVGVRCGALSVDHLEFTGDEEIKLLLNSSTMPCLLPGTAFFLKLEYPPARKMIDAGLPVALASDYNPGSSPSGKMQFVLTLASLYMGMRTEEAINAATLNGAAAMDLLQRHGSVDRGMKASFFITEPLPGLDYFSYAYSSQLIRNVMVSGEWIR